MGKRLKKVAELATKFSVSGMTDIQKQPCSYHQNDNFFCSIYTGHCSMTIKAFHPRFQDGILNLLEKIRLPMGSSPISTVHLWLVASRRSAWLRMDGGTFQIYTG